MGKKKQVIQTNNIDNNNGKNKPHTNYVYQGLIILSLVLPWTFIESVSIEKIIQSLGSLQILPTKGEKELGLLLLSLSTPHIFYYIVWTNAKAWDKFCKKLGLGESYKVFANCAHFIKFQQAVCFTLWYVGSVEALIHGVKNPFNTAEKLIEIVRALSSTQLLAAIELILLGQLFNGGVYYAIGDAGVYYGCRLGQKVPWVFTFPFNVINHPQYRGATISIFGFIILLANSDTIERGIVTIALVMAAYYQFSGYVEEHI